METKASLDSKIMQVRLALSTEMEKSGKNNYSKYDYFQLKDFMPRATALCNEVGLYTKFWVDSEKRSIGFRKVTEGEVVTEEEKFEYKEYAYLLVRDMDTGEEDIYKKETANCNVQGAQPIQNLGAKSTYMKRYMYMDLFEINENDAIEENTGKPEKVEAPKVAKKAPVKTAKVDSKPVEEVKPADFETPKEPVVAAQEPVNTAELMSMAHKMELAKMIKEAGMDPKTTIVTIAKELNTDVPYLTEGQFETIKKRIGEMK